MKVLIPSAFLAALVAFLVFPISFELGGAILAAAGLGAIAVLDYSRAPRALPVPARVAVASSRQEKLGLAA